MFFNSRTVPTPDITRGFDSSSTLLQTDDDLSLLHSLSCATYPYLVHANAFPGDGPRRAPFIVGAELGPEVVSCLCPSDDLPKKPFKLPSTTGFLRLGVGLVLDGTRLVGVVRLREVSRVLRLPVVAVLLLRAADNVLDDVDAAVVLGLLLGVCLEVLSRDQGGEEEAVEGLTDGAVSAAVDGTLLLHDLHLVLLAVHAADKFIHESLYLVSL